MCTKHHNKGFLVFLKEKNPRIIFGKRPGFSGGRAGGPPPKQNPGGNFVKPAGGATLIRMDPFLLA